MTGPNNLSFSISANRGQFMQDMAAVVVDSMKYGQQSAQNFAKGWGGVDMKPQARKDAGGYWEGFGSAFKDLSASFLSSGSMKAFGAGLALQFAQWGGQAARALSDAMAKALKDHLVPLFKNAANVAANSFMEGLDAIRRFKPEMYFDTITNSLQGVIGVFGQFGDSVAAALGKVAGPMGEIFGAGVEAMTFAMEKFTEMGGAYLNALSEIGEKYQKVAREIAGATTDMQQVAANTDMVREIMGSGAIDHMEDVSESISRFSNTLGLGGEDLKRFTQNYASMAELVGGVNVVNIAGVMQAFEGFGDKGVMSAEEMNETLTVLGNTIRDTGGEGDRLLSSLINSGPAMRQLGYDAQGTMLMFGSMVKEGERGTRLVYAMNQVVEKLNAKVSEGEFSSIQEGWDKLVQTIKKAPDDAAIGILKGFTTPQAATLFAESIKKEIIKTPQEFMDLLSSPEGVEKFKANMADAATATTSLEAVLENLMQVFEASLAPVGLALNQALQGPLNGITEWMSENQTTIAEWGANLADVFLTGFQKFMDFSGMMLEGFAGVVNEVMWAIGNGMKTLLAPFRWILDLLEHLPEKLGGGMFDAAKQGLDDLNEGFNKIAHLDLEAPTKGLGKGIRDIAAGVPGVKDALRDAVGQFTASEEFKRAMSFTNAEGNDQSVFQPLPENATLDQPLLRFDKTLTEEQKQDFVDRLRQMHFDVEYEAENGLIRRITGTTEESQQTLKDWFDKLSKSQYKADITGRLVDEDGTPIDSDNKLKLEADVEANVDVTTGPGKPAWTLPSARASAAPPAGGAGVYVPQWPAGSSMATTATTPGGAGSSGGGGGGRPDVGVYAPGPLPGAPTFLPSESSARSAVGTQGTPIYTGGRTENTGGGVHLITSQVGHIVENMFGSQGAWIGNDYRAPDGFNEHSSGEAFDIMTEKAVGQLSEAGLKMGDTMNEWLLQNAELLGIQYTIWREQNWNPGQAPTPNRAGGAITTGHYDHIHVRLDPSKKIDPAVLASMPGAAAAAAQMGADAATAGGALAAAAAASGAAVAAAPSKKEGWKYNAEGKPLSAPEGTNPDEFLGAVADWYRGRGEEPPPAYANYGTHGQGTTAPSPFAGVKTSEDLAALKKSGEWAKLSESQQKELISTVVDNAKKDAENAKKGETAADKQAEAADKQEKAATEQAKAAYESGKAATATAQAAQVQAQAAQAQAAATQRPYGPGLNESYAAQAAIPGKVSAGMQWAKDTYGGKGGIPGYLTADGKPIQAPGSSPKMSGSLQIQGYTTGLGGVPVKQRDMGQDVKNWAGAVGGAVKNAWNWVQEKGTMVPDATNKNDNNWSPKKWLLGKLGFAGGGGVQGPGSGTSDDILALLSNGEHVWTAAEVQAAGGHGAVAAFRDAVRSGQMPRFAPGGAVGDSSGAFVEVKGVKIPMMLYNLGSPTLGSGREVADPNDPNNPWVNPRGGSYSDMYEQFNAYVTYQQQIYDQTYNANQLVKDQLKIQQQIAEEQQTQTDAMAEYKQLESAFLKKYPTAELQAMATEDQKALDAAWKLVEKSQDRLDQYQENLGDKTRAAQRLEGQMESTAAKGSPSAKKQKGGDKGDKDAQDLGKGLVTGLFEGLGFPDVFGEAFTEWGIWKKGMQALGLGLNWAQESGLLGGPGEGNPLGGGMGLNILGGASQQLMPGAADKLPQMAGSGAPGGGGGGGGGALGGLLGIIPGVGTGPAPGPASAVTSHMSASGQPQNLANHGTPQAGSPGPTNNFNFNGMGPQAVNNQVNKANAIAGTNSANFPGY